MSIIHSEPESDFSQKIADIEESLNDIDNKLKDLDYDVRYLQKDVHKLDPKNFPRFYVWKSGTVKTEDHYPLIFNEIDYNDGNMYDFTTGKVKVDYSGMYIFSTSFYKYADINGGQDGVQDIVQVSIYINGDEHLKSKT